MARVCCVEGCDALAKEDITYFPFPIKQSLRRKWRDAVRTVKLTGDSLVCSRHFTTADYETVRGKVRLKAKVVPSLFGCETKPPKSPNVSENGSSETTNGNHEPPTNDNSNHTTNAEISKQIDELIEKNQELCSQELDNKELDSQELDNKELDSQELDNKELGSQELDKQKLDKQELNDEEEDYVDFGVECELMEGIDENGLEQCTIECGPESILAHPEDSGSGSDAEQAPGADIEDIIANYHIKQDPRLADRLKEAQETESTTAASPQSQDRAKSDRRRGPAESEDMEVEFIASESTFKDPVFIEMSVGQDSNPAADDCLLLLEKVQVDVDPASLFPHAADQDDSSVEEVPRRKEVPISLLTSSDEDEVIIEEPHIDTVEVSDETDEDDMPLVKLVQPVKSTLKNLLWKGKYEFFCCQCHYKTTIHGDFIRHKFEHTKANPKILHVCDICNFTSASRVQFSRHKKKHKEEKRYKCHLCDYKAKHKMSLIYHLKSHDGANPKSLDKSFSCSKCHYSTSAKNDVLKHIKLCVGVKMHSCDKCRYASKRRSDLKRHRARRHLEENSEEDDDYVPPPHVKQVQI